MGKRRRFRRPAAEASAARGAQSGLAEEPVPPSPSLPQRRPASSRPATAAGEPALVDDQDDHIRELTALVDFFRRDD